MKIVIAGDFVPTESNYNLFEQNNIKKVFGVPLIERWRESDFRIVNIEVPITDVKEPVPKSGPNLKVPTRCMPGIESMNISVASLANNHILDYGTAGLESTISILSSIGMQISGAGKNIEKASKPVTLKKDNVTVGLYSCAEHEYSSASERKAGANVIGVDTSLHINELKRESDYVIVLFHGGKEHYPYPTPDQQSRCRSFIKAGADIVICQHSHCIGSKEDYLGKTIVYGQGNFLFDYKDLECWDTGLLIELNIKRNANDDLSTEISYIPILRNGSGIRMAEVREKEKIIDGFIKRSNNLKDEDFMQEKEQLLRSEGFDSLYFYAGKSRLFRGVDKRLLNRALMAKKYVGEKTLNLLGLLQCETHRELVLMYLREKINETR